MVTMRDVDDCLPKLSVAEAEAFCGVLLPTAAKVRGQGRGSGTHRLLACHAEEPAAT